MSKATVLQQGINMTSNQGDPVSMSNFYDEVVYDLGQMPVLTNFSIVGVTAGDNSIALPDQSIQLRGMVYGDKWLTEMRISDINALTKMWRDIANPTIQCYVLEQSDHLDVLVFPTPRVTGATIVTQVYNATYPDGNMVMFYTEYRANVPLYLEFKVLFDMLSREYARSSDHMDTDGSTLAGQLSEFLLSCCV